MCSAIVVSVTGRACLLAWTGRVQMKERIRVYAPEDEEPIVELSLRAWAPVFESLERVLGREIFVRLHGDWRPYQERAVRDTLADETMMVWVAEGECGVVAFVAARLHPERRIGEISMLAVEPDDQLRGTGTALTEFATDRLRDAGMIVAMVDTVGDPGHAPARRVYEKAGYTPLPVVRYFRAL
jgi:GNAT superfamily N-acetyltransferase